MAMDKKLFNSWLGILSTFLEANPDIQGGEKLTGLLSLLGASASPSRKKPKITKAYRAQVDSLMGFLPDRPNMIFDSKALVDMFNLLSGETINRVLGGAKCLGRYRQYVPVRDERGTVTGWCFDPSGANEELVDLEHDYIRASAAKQQVSATARLTKLEDYYKFGRQLGMAYNPLALAAKQSAAA